MSRAGRYHAALERKSISLAKEIAHEAGGLRVRTADLIEEMGDTAVDLYRDTAPERTGRLKRGITAYRGLNQGMDATVQVFAKAVDPRTGVDYTGVTRFGHRPGPILPIKARALRWWDKGGKKFIAASSPGYHPDTDWAEEAEALVQARVSDQLEDFGEDIMERIGRFH